MYIVILLCASYFSVPSQIILVSVLWTTNIMFYFIILPLQKPTDPLTIAALWNVAGGTFSILERSTASGDSLMHYMYIKSGKLPALLLYISPFMQKNMLLMLSISCLS